MIKTVLPAAVAALALVVPAIGHAQMAPPMQPAAQPNGMMTNGSMTNASVTTGQQPQWPGVNDMGQGYAQPMGQAYGGPTQGYAQPMSPRTTWIPGHYNWDPNTSNYVWTTGQYVEAPTEAAQWIPGHWVQTPTSWIWIEGGWR